MSMTGVTNDQPSAYGDRWRRPARRAGTASTHHGIRASARRSSSVPRRIATPSAARSASRGELVVRRLPPGGDLVLREARGRDTRSRQRRSTSSPAGGRGPARRPDGRPRADAAAQLSPMTPAPTTTTPLRHAVESAAPGRFHRPCGWSIARCQVDYAGRLTAHLPMATRLLDGQGRRLVLVHSDGGSYKPLNWMSPPCTLRRGGRRRRRRAVDGHQPKGGRHAA